MMLRGFLSFASSSGPPRRPAGSPLPADASPATPARITAPEDYTSVYQESPLIRHSDNRFQESAFFGYFPPSVEAGQHSMVYCDADVERIKKAADWPAWSSPIQPPEGGPSYSIRSNGHGLGMYATRAIPAGDLVAAERPIYILPAKTPLPDPSRDCSADFHRRALSYLSAEKQAAFLALSNSQSTDTDEILGRILTNIQILEGLSQSESDLEEIGGVFETLSRANHSCSPNMNFFFECKDATGRLYAAQDIAEGDELTLAYVTTLHPRAKRQALLLMQFGFLCHCPACSYDARTFHQGEAKREHIRRVTGYLYYEPAVRIPPEEVERALAYAQEERIWKTHAYLLMLLALPSSQGVPANPERLQMRPQRIREAIVAYMKLEGEDSYNVRDLQKELNALPDPWMASPPRDPEYESLELD